MKTVNLDEQKKHLKPITQTTIDFSKVKEFVGIQHSRDNTISILAILGERNEKGEIIKYAAHHQDKELPGGEQIRLLIAEDNEVLAVRFGRVKLIPEFSE